MKTKKEINLKGLGRRQRELLKRLKDEKLKIVVVTDHYENLQEIELKNENDDLFENLPMKLIVSLGKRNVFCARHWVYSIRMEFTTLTIKDEVIKKLE